MDNLNIDADNNGAHCTDESASYAITLASEHFDADRFPPPYGIPRKPYVKVQFSIAKEKKGFLAETVDINFMDTTAMQVFQLNRDIIFKDILRSLTDSYLRQKAIANFFVRTVDNIIPSPSTQKGSPLVSVIVSRLDAGYLSVVCTVDQDTAVLDKLYGTEPPKKET